MPKAASQRPPRVTPADAIELLRKEYGPVRWTPRYDPLSELVFTILSQHTSDINSGRAFDNLLRVFGSMENVAGASLRDIEDAIRTAGLAKIKAPRIKETLEKIKEKTGAYDLAFLGEMSMPEAKAWLKDLPGIGPKTAAIVLCFSFGMPAMPVDTHIHRVSKRLGFIGPRVSADKAHDILEKMVPEDQVFPFHVYLINHGRRVCNALRPRCGDCVLAWGCPSRDQFLLPKKPARPKRGAPEKKRVR
ncbi:MAG: endonuclease III [SAR202 cluster bacterium]|nr:endonuclease III [SAR202 cluster bacterium]